MSPPVFVTATGSPVKFNEVISLATREPEFKTDIPDGTIVSIAAQVLSPRKNLVLSGSPVADNSMLKVPVSIIGPPLTLIYPSPWASTLVTVPLPASELTKVTKSATVKPTVWFSFSLSVPKM
jgi:hypothetical protein